MERTTDEIIARIKEIDANPNISLSRMELLWYLPHDLAKQFLLTEFSKWEVQPKNRDAIISQVHDYMPFAWDKANECKGLSAWRSMEHMSAWLWMLGEDLAAEDIEEYDFYGKPQLAAICEHFGWDWKQWDWGGWVNSEEGPVEQPYIVKLRWK